MPKTVIIIDYKIFHMRTLGLLIQNNGPATVKLTIFHNHGNYPILQLQVLYFVLIDQMCACE